MTNIWATTPNRSGHLRVDLSALHRMLRLPADVAIVAVRPAENSQQCIIELRGPSLPYDGELIADYRYEHLTHITFQGFRK